MHRDDPVACPVVYPKSRPRGLLGSLGRGQDDKEVVHLERSVLREVCAVDGVLHFALAVERPQRGFVEVVGDLWVVRAAELAQRGDGVGGRLREDHLEGDALAAYDLVDPVGVLGHDALIHLEKLVGIRPRQLQHVAALDHEAAVCQAARYRTELAFLHGVWPHEQQRAQLHICGRRQRQLAKKEVCFPLCRWFVCRARHAGLAANRRGPLGHGVLPDELHGDARPAAHTRRERTVRKEASGLLTQVEHAQLGNDQPARRRKIEPLPARGERTAHHIAHSRSCFCLEGARGKIIGVRNDSELPRIDGNNAALVQVLELHRRVITPL
mmetsp:Transcript_39603/g.84346  ORF Transcript_39603/g.84346 Transcript_39603/m.84346 type:complete len:326 (+) Transcript_39603:543-1520(+)